MTFWSLRTLTPPPHMFDNHPACWFCNTCIPVSATCHTFSLCLWLQTRWSPRKLRFFQLVCILFWNLFKAAFSFTICQFPISKLNVFVWLVYSQSQWLQASLGRIWERFSNLSHIIRQHDKWQAECLWCLCTQYLLRPVNVTQFVWECAALF